ncbi:MFS transporter [Actinosynnema sp. ALI-1.44]|uniref:MFS transporter n=1 Tax=Actinosynnema sp. ALI-1.44 TaxID=1933779 RepID=UPI00097C6D3D|nr:MFS transporter [Actinosynnema sp. ALI-1.44]ONI84116.1 MFS transporter [Actinosynnema sp. ALI-1.44]
METTGLAAPRTERATTRRWLAVAVVGVGVFAMITAEQLPVGLLSRIGADLSISDGTVGLLVTAPGVVAAICSLLVPLSARRMDRRLLLAGLLLLMVVAQVMTVLADNLPVLIAARVLVGVTIGGFWATAGSLAVRLVPAHHVPRATSIIFGGVAAGNVLGVPAGTRLGELVGWRAAFLTLGGLGLLLFVGMLVLLPRLAAAAPIDLTALRTQWRNPAVRAAMLATLLIVAGHYAAFTYLSPLLRDVSGVGAGMVSSVLLVYGVAGLVSNFIAGSAAGSALRRTVAVVVFALAATVLLFPLLGVTTVGGFALVLVWGLAFGGVGVALQTWIIRVATTGAEAATVLNVTVFNFAIALGAFAGGFIVDNLGLSTMMWVSGALIAVSLLTVLSARTTTPLADSAA